MRSLYSAILLGAVVACGDPDPGGYEPPACEAAAARSVYEPPPGAAPGEVQRWLIRRWTSPLGLTIERHGVAIDGVPVHGRHEIRIYDRSGQLVDRRGSADQVMALASSRAAALHHPARGLRAAAAQPRALQRTTQRAVWYHAGDRLVAAVRTDRINLRSEPPVAEVTLADATTGARLARYSAITELTDPEYLVYARTDGRPLMSPLGDTFPHATGVPDGQVPPFEAPSTHRQSTVEIAGSAPWVYPGGNQTDGNHVLAFFNSWTDGDGRVAELSDEPPPEQRNPPDDLGNDFLAQATGNRFAFPYDPARTSSEYFQNAWLEDPESVIAPPDRGDAALNAKIVQAFYSANWLHEYFYRAGFDEVAGNAQQVNFGRGGAACDPLIVHASFWTTFTFPTLDGESPALSMGLNNRSASKRDSTMDFSVFAHEWGHYLVGRLAGTTADTMANLQGRSIHEAVADFVGVLVNLDGDDDLNGAFAVGAYTNLDYIERRSALPPEEAASDPLYYGIRRYPYSMDLATNPLTFRHLAEPPPTALPYYNWKGRGPLLSEEHTAGEIFTQALFQCFGRIVAAHPPEADEDFEALRTRMAEYLVAGLAAFPDRPSLLEARDAFLEVIRLSDAVDHAACRAGFAERGMGALAVGPDGEFGEGSEDPFPSYDPADIQESFVDADAAR